MTAGTTIRVETDTATPELRKLLSSLTPENLAARCGPALQRLTQDHLAALGPNYHGYPSTHFWAKFVPNIRWQPEESGVSVSIQPVTIHGRSVGLRQPVYGGPIEPQAAKMLAIPMSAISYGHVPADFPDLIVVRTAKGAFLCQLSGSGNGSEPSIGRRQNGTAGAPNSGNLVFLFILVRSVMQAGNLAVLPSDEEYLQAARTAIGGAN
ncbi:MAG TPA: hypothetical protein VK815_07910 [Candidatus Acidoferrales bacterium]|jgi:hypothetical protein|nr:hypothetical protein [Candidatus Acidoferrales bacterium]